MKARQSVTVELIMLVWISIFISCEDVSFYDKGGKRADVSPW